jgi:hypothetical protein
MFLGLGDTSSPPNVQAIANAIATAEGGLTPGTFPYRTNNPCDVFVGGSTAGYATMQDGWNACYNQINLMLSGNSSVYTPDESISDIAASYAPASAGNNPSAWANNVASALGLSPSDPLTAVSGGSGAGTSDTGLPGLPTLDFSDVDLSITDGSGNLTGVGWGLVVVGVGLLAWALIS